MLTRPLVSIVTPVLNSGRSIHACLASVAAQSYPSVEHIVVDGGSTDDTLEVIKEFRGQRDLRLISEPDNGMYDAINKGLAMARGEVVAYLNGDDFYFPWSLEVAVDTLQQGADVAYGDLGVLMFPSEDATTFFVQAYPSFSLTYYTHVGTLGQPTVFWRRSLTQKIGEFDTDYRLIGDCEYWLRAAVAGASFVHVNEILAVQIDHEGTLRASRPEQLRVEFERLRREYSSVAPPPPWPRFQSMRKGLRWRRLQIELMIEVYRRMPRRWPRFIGFLKENELELMRPARALASILPSRVRPSWAMRVDKSPFEGKLLELIGSGGRLRP